MGVGVRVRVLGLRLESVVGAQHDDEKGTRDDKVKEHHPVLPLPIEACRQDAGRDHEDIRPLASCSMR